MRPVVSREMDEFLLSTPINPNNFPAKLWRIVNSPRYRSIRWDPRGEGLVVDQQLFEAELLAPVKSAEAEAELLFKTTNFTSFIRQLNLYGFRKVGQGGGGDHPVAGEQGAGDGLLHHFHNPSFKQDRPELLVNMKRLTSANKAKLAAGLQVNTRPPNRFQRYLSSSVDTTGQAKGDRHGPVTVGQLQRTFRRDNLSPYPFMSSTHNQSPLHTVSIKNLSGSNPGGLDRTPIPPRTWHNSIGLVAGQIDTTSSSPFSDKAIPFSVIQRFPTEVTYTLQPNPNNVHVQQGSQEIGTAGQKYTSYLTSPSQYHQAFYPTAVLQCCPPNSHLDPLTGCPNTNTSSYPNYNYYQTIHGTDYQTGSLDPTQISDRSKTIISALLSDFDIPKNTIEANTIPPDPTKTRQQNSNQQAKSPVDVACNQDHFQKEEDICVWETEANHSPHLSP
ncbi:heat shock factor protein 5 isoform X2 [Narcine bancroftii]|uniref:heat shock factor protein 5 isoform X2 n=1 Tax=Narcine bancroftii TaxID=1343680 RepID=UPI003830FD25